MANKTKKEFFLKKKVSTRNFVAGFDFLDNHNFNVFFAISKLSAKKAVNRNKLKRIFREKARRNLKEFLDKKLSLCFIAKKGVKLEIEGKLIDFNNEIEILIGKIIEELR